MANINNGNQNEGEQNGNRTSAIAPQEEARRISPAELIENVYFFRWFFFGIFALVISFSILYAIFASPIYVSDALIQVEQKKGNGGLGAIKDVQVESSQSSPLIGEMEILQSRAVIGEASEALKANIDIKVDNRLPIIGGWLSRILDKGPDGLAIPMWPDSALAWGGEELRITHLGVPPSAYGKPLFLKVGPEQSWILSNKLGKELLVGQGIETEAMSSDKQYALALEKLKARPGTVFKLTVYDPLASIGAILGAITTSESKRGSNLIRVTFSNTSPYRAAEMLTAVVNAYVGQNISRRSEESKKSLDFLNSEMPRIKSKLENDEQILSGYRHNNRASDLPGEVPALIAQTTGVEKDQLELELKLKEFQIRYQPDHPLMKGLRLQLDQLKTQAGALDQKISQLPQAQQDYIRKELEVVVNRQLYVSLLNNAQQLQIAKAGTIGNVYVVDPPVAPLNPSRPKKPLVVAIGALLGLILGFAVCQVLALLSGIVRDPKKLEQEVGLTTFAIMPIAKEQTDVIAASNDQAVFMLSKEKPTAVPVEALRSLRTSTLFALSEKPRSKVILITSAVPSQGKSFISANLAYLLASTNKRVLLLEADVRKASLRRYIPFDKKDLGLTSVLRDDQGVDSVILKNVYENLDFLPAGHAVKNPGDMLSSDAMIHLINTMADRYDYVVIDSPPLLPVNDARSLARAADVTLFVARQEMTSVAEIRAAIDIFDKGGSTIDGLVFNGFVPSQLRYGYNYGYGYRNYGLYGRNGKYGGKYGGKYEQSYGAHKEYRYKDYGPKEDDESK